MAKPGPRPRGEYAGKGATLSARITIGTRQSLAAAAEVNGRSISAELEARLARSFGSQADLRDWGSDESYAVLRAVAEGMKDAENLVGQPRLGHAYARALMIEVAHHILEALRPSGKPVPPVTFPNLPHLDDLPGAREALRKHLAKQSPKTIALPLAATVIARLQAAATSGSVEFGVFQQIASVLAPHITKPVLPIPDTDGGSL
jgi:hypothetical protein